MSQSPVSFVNWLLGISHFFGKHAHDDEDIMGWLSEPEQYVG